MNVLVLNAGSATLKFQVIRTDADRIAADNDERLAKGLVERIGGEALLRFEVPGKTTKRSSAPIRDHRAAVDTVLRWLVSEESETGITSLADIEAGVAAVLADVRAAYGDWFTTRGRLDEVIAALPPGQAGGEAAEARAFLEWLRENEPVVWEFLKDKEPLDFLTFKNYSYASAQVFSHRRWSCVGDAIAVRVDDCHG